MKLGSPSSPHPTSSKHHHVRTRWPLVAIVVAAVAAIAGWTLVERLTSTSESVAPRAAAPLAAAPFEISSVAALQRQPQASGYAIPVTGVLHPLTKSAAGDSLGALAIRRLALGLRVSMADTVLTGHHDLVAWNARFGAARLTRMVERPVTGPGGQLDEVET
jgi:hypothetical protein